MSMVYRIAILCAFIAFFCAVMAVQYGCAKRDPGKNLSEILNSGPVDDFYGHKEGK